MKSKKQPRKMDRMKSFLHWWTKVVQSPHLINNDEFERIYKRI